MAAKTRPTGADVTTFLDSVASESRRAEGHAAREMLERVTGTRAEMWGPSIVGFGSRPSSTSRGTDEWFVVGFSPRAAALTFYGLLRDDDGGADPMLEALGPHTTGTGCLYLKHLDRVDAAALERLVRRAWDRVGP